MHTPQQDSERIVRFAWTEQAVLPRPLYGIRLV